MLGASATSSPRRSRAKRVAGRKQREQKMKELKLSNSHHMALVDDNFPSLDAK